MEINDSLACCGINEVLSEGFENIPTKKAWKDYVRENVHNNWDEFPGYDGYGADIPDGDNNNHYLTGALLATAIDSQKDYMKWLKKMGFDLVRRFMNHNTGNYVSLFIYEIEKEEGDCQ